MIFLKMKEPSSATSDTASMQSVSLYWCLEVILNVLLIGIFVFKLIALL